MGVDISRLGRESTEIGGINQVINNSNVNNEAPNTNIPNSRLNLIYNQISSSKIKKKKSRNELFYVSFSSYFYIAGRRFKNLLNHTQTFLFGDQLDLSFILAHKPVVFPHEIPNNIDLPYKYLQSLVNIRKDTIKLLKYSDDLNNTTESSNKYNIEFRFDCDCDVSVRIHYFASEKYIPHLSTSMSTQLLYVCGCFKFKKCNCLIKDEDNAPIIYRKGANILFKHPTHLIIPDSIDFNHWQFNINLNYYPIVIECRPLNEKLAINHAHITLAYLDKTNHSSNIKNTQNELSTANNNSIYSLQSQLNNSNSYQIKPIKQKQFINGVLYSLQEIYGIEKKSSDSSDEIITDSTKNNNSEQFYNSQTSSSITTSFTAITAAFSNASSTTSLSLKRMNQNEISLDSSCKEDDFDEKKRKIEREIEQEMKGIECVICMCETRDTLILPCRHLCLCKMCAINLRIQSNNCPICRIPFIALIQIRLLKKKQPENYKQLLKKTFKINQLPVLKIENLNILLNTDNLSRNDGNINENEIFEENYQIKCENENDNDNFIKKDIVVCTQNIKPRLLDNYEILTIYEAFNESDIHNLNQNENKNSKKPKQKKLSKQISFPIEKSNKDENEAIIEITNNQINNNVVSIINNNGDLKNFKTRSKLPIEIRSSSVLVNQLDTKNYQQKSIRSASYVGNYNSIQQQETIQMGDI